MELSHFAGSVLLIANTASRCGFTPQYAGLEELYGQLKDRGFSVLAFPCDQFGHQEPGSNAEIGVFCQRNYGVSVPGLREDRSEWAGRASGLPAAEARAAGIAGAGQDPVELH